VPAHTRQLAKHTPRKALAAVLFERSKEELIEELNVAGKTAEESRNDEFVPVREVTTTDEHRWIRILASVGTGEQRDHHLVIGVGRGHVYRKSFPSMFIRVYPWLD
jgi:hypothetical protein